MTGEWTPHNDHPEDFDDPTPDDMAAELEWTLHGDPALDDGTDHAVTDHARPRAEMIRDPGEDMADRWNESH